MTKDGAILLHTGVHSVEICGPKTTESFFRDLPVDMAKSLLNTTEAQLDIEALVTVGLLESDRPG